MEAMGAVVAGVVMAVYAFTVVAPYFISEAAPAGMVEIIKANKNTVDLITTAVVMFYFGASVSNSSNRRRAQDFAAGSEIRSGEIRSGEISRM